MQCDKFSWLNEWMNEWNAMEAQIVGWVIQFGVMKEGVNMTESLRR